MSIFHYFSQDANKRAKFIFNLIAPIYAKADSALQNNYKESIKIVNSEINIENKSVLDIGTGTGAWAAMFLKHQAKAVTGIDLANKMLVESRKKNPQIYFQIGDAEDLYDFKDNSFDIVTASYVIHGVKADRRARIISEMKRVSKQHVVIHDFSGETPLFVRFLEFMEKSDYKNFKKNICNELKVYFSNSKKINSDNGTGIYFAEK